MKIARKHNGFAMVTAIVLLGLTSIAMAVIGVAFKMQATRTQLQIQQAQIRQLLLAGSKEAQERLGSGKQVDEAVVLPAELAESAAVLTLSSSDRATGTGRVTVEIEAALPHCRGAERVVFAGSGSDWRMVSAELGE
jgi:hypothetical protein